MNLDFDSGKPIFLQIADGIEDAICTGAFPEESQIPSITEFSVTYRINPATALKGINLLVDEGIIYKKRGIGMFVSTNAKEILQNKRKEKFFENYISSLLNEAKKLNISTDEIIAMIKRENE